MVYLQGDIGDADIHREITLVENDDIIAVYLSSVFGIGPLFRVQLDSLANQHCP